jgi:hypothetical protein
LVAHAVTSSLHHLWKTFYVAAQLCSSHDCELRNKNDLVHEMSGMDGKGGWTLYGTLDCELLYFSHSLK